MKVLFVVNPAAGHGRGGKRWATVKTSASGLWPEHEARVTERPGHGVVLAREAVLSGVDLVVAVGGDGTLGEVVDGFLSVPESARHRSLVSTFPAGSGCDFARHAGISADPGAWVAAMSAGRRRRLDGARATFRTRDGELRSRHFLNVAALGLAGAVAEGVHARGKPLGGTLTYLLEGLVAVAGAKARDMRLVVDGKPEAVSPYHLVAAANTSTIGGGMKIAPDADAEDGLLDLLTVGPMSRGALLRLLPSVYSGGHLGAKGVVLRRARRVEIETDEPMPLNLDGDLDGATPAVFEALPKAIAFFL